MLPGAPDRDRRFYECRDCLARVEIERPLATCPDCDGGLQNLAVPRE